MGYEKIKMTKNKNVYFFKYIVVLNLLQSLKKLKIKLRFNKE